MRKDKELVLLLQGMNAEEKFSFLQILFFMHWKSGRRANSPYDTPTNIMLGCVKYYLFKAQAAAVMIADYLTGCVGNY